MKKSSAMGVSIVGASFLLILFFALCAKSMGGTGTFFSEYDCNVARLALAGDLYTSPMYTSGAHEWIRETYSEDTIASTQSADSDSNIRALVLEVDSYGGSAVAGEEISNALKRFGKLSVAVIRDAGVSAAYWAATGADVIFASANSDVGSIGVIYSYLDNVKKNEIEGLNYNVIKTGKYKTLGDPKVTLTPDEYAVIKRDLDLIHQNFISAVSENRELALEDVASMADGSSWLGQDALARGLIDEIGDMNDAKTYLSTLLDEDVEVCADDYFKG